jgi:hypothetical protein
MDSLQGVRYGSQIAAAAQANRLDPALLAAVAAQETGGPGASSGNNIVGDHGHGHGLFQIDDRYHAFASTPAAMDPASNADYAGRLLSGLLTKYGGNVHAALSAYNAGSPDATGTTTAWPDGSTLGYADSVLRHYDQIAGSATPSTGAGTASTAAGTTASATGTTASTAVDSLQVPQLTLPSFTPPNWSFQPFSSELEKGGGQQAHSSDEMMAGLVDPADNDSSASKSEG